MLSKDEAFRLTRFSADDIAPNARAVRDEVSLHAITYSPKVTIPITDSESVRTICVNGVKNHCSEATFMLENNANYSYDNTESWLAEKGYSSTIDFIADMSRIVITEYSMLPHVNSGAISDREIRLLKEVSVSQGMMLESIAGRLCEPGGPHFGYPDKSPARRLATLESAGRAQVPFTTGLLVGIGDTRHERIEGLLALRDLNAIYGHIQEIIIANYPPITGVVASTDDDHNEKELLWTISAARLIFGDSSHIQTPRSNCESVSKLIDAGADDLGGIELAGEDPAKSWQTLKNLSDELLEQGKRLKARACIYPEYIGKPGFLAKHLNSFVSTEVDSNGYLKIDPIKSTSSNSHPKSIKESIDLTKPEVKEKIPFRSKRLGRGSNLPTSKPRS